jgi:pimeloyl-ACP methyl ester carboxylesterase
MGFVVAANVAARRGVDRSPCKGGRCWDEPAFELAQRFARRFFTTHRHINGDVCFPPDTSIAVRKACHMQPIKHARADDVTPALHTTLEGAQQSGPTILLVHGFAGSARAWDPLMAALTAAHRIVRVDLVGHGLSPKPMRGYSMRDQVEAICRSLDHLAVTSVVAVGHSGGGDIVVEMIKRHPSRLAGALLLGTPPNLNYVNLPISARIISAPLLGYLVWRSLTDAMIRRSLVQTFAPGFDANPAVCAPLIEDLRRMTHNSYVAARAAVEGYRKERDLTARVADRPVPILVAFGDQDRWVDPCALDAWKPIAKTHVFRGVGHTPMLEDPSATAELILDFARWVGSNAA